MFCSECKAVLPDTAQFCLRCGLPTNAALDPRGSFVNRVRPATSRRGLGIAMWVFVALLFFSIALTAFRNSPLLQQFQEYVSWSQDRTIAEASFAVKPGSFSSYEFAVPAGAADVSVEGEFSAAGSADRRNHSDSDIEVYVLTDSAFVVWRNGYSTGSAYESGRVAQGTIHGVLPPGAGIYYIVFSNKFAPRTTKTIHANLLLHYRSLLPDSLLRMKDRFLNW